MEFPENKKIVLFDGVCNYCNEKVNFIIKHDEQDIFRFVAIQSEKGQEIIKYLGIQPTFDSIILYEPGIAYYIKSEAIFTILKNLKSSYKWILIFNLMPYSIINLVYDYIAKNRYKWYGKKDTCLIPSPEIKSKFL